MDRGASERLEQIFVILCKDRELQRRTFRNHGSPLNEGQGQLDFRELLLMPILHKFHDKTL